MHAQRRTPTLGMLQRHLEFSLPLFFQVHSLGVEWPDTIHYRGQTTASPIIILPQPRQCALLLSCLFTLQICSQQQLWRWSVERTYVHVWKSLPFPLLPCCAFKGLFQSESLHTTAQPLQLQFSEYEWALEPAFLISTPGDPHAGGVLDNPSRPQLLPLYSETYVLCSVTNIFAVPCPSQSQKLTIFVGVLCLPLQVCTLTTE